MSAVDVVLAESDREIDPASVARMRRSKDPARRKKGGLLQAVLDYREEHGVGPQADDTSDRGKGEGDDG